VDETTPWVSGVDLPAGRCTAQFRQRDSQKVRPFRDPQGSNRIGLIVETPDLETWHAALQTDHAQEAMKHDGVRPDTILQLAEG